ncbi:replicative DNA helicase [Fontisphaera persica]|uniref:replicative DNA helicase n=1 Tax=Fontisphaera persica TaxID=2974023 RepID=UPI0024C03CF4|nr:replicative DNA helicase [Fontisphaera persica]WCJ58893.1 replicative DNA helicase [Fontisphaera persica]
MLNEPQQQPTDAGEPGEEKPRARRREAGRQTAGRQTPLDRLPPHSLEAERAVLACLLLDPQEGLGSSIQRFKVGKNQEAKSAAAPGEGEERGGQRFRDRRLKEKQEIFYDLKHQVIYEHLVQMFDRREPIDMVTLLQRLQARGDLEKAGGAAYLASLLEAEHSAANLSYYMDIVWGKYILRKLLHACTDIIQNVYDYKGDVDALLDQVETDILRLSEERVEEKSMKMHDLVMRSIQIIEERHQRKGQITGLSTGFPDLDDMTTGLHGGEMFIIAARPSIGKTSLAMNIAEHVALELKQPVGIFSLEMTAESLVLRMMSSRARVNAQNLRSGFLNYEDFQRLTQHAAELSQAPLYIDDTANLSILQLRARARRLHQQYGIQLFVIDYLQLLHSTSSRALENRQQEIADISKGIKALAKELNVPIIVLSQLNREMEKRESKPRLSDLRESGSIEQDADVVGLLYRADPKSPYKAAPMDGDESGEMMQAEAIPVNLLIAKQRNGPTGDIRLMFVKGYTRFESVAKVEPEDVPVTG